MRCIFIVLNVSCSQINESLKIKREIDGKINLYF